MNWQIILAEQVARWVRIWTIRYPGLLPILQQRLLDLAAAPEQHLQEVVVPFADRRAYRFIVQQGSGIGEILHVSFVVRVVPAQQQLHIETAHLVRESTYLRFPDEDP